MPEDTIPADVLEEFDAQLDEYIEDFKDGIREHLDDLSDDDRGPVRRAFDAVRRTVTRSAPVPIYSEFAGMPVAIEYPAGERRLIKNAAGEAVYDRTMKFPYGFIRHTVGRDGDEIDCILGKNENARQVFIVDMQDLGPDEEAREDEDKVCVGFNDLTQALAAFESMYPRDWARGVTSVPTETFRERILTTA